VHVEVAQRLLPLGERIGSRAVLPARVSERAESARRLEHGVWLRRAVRAVLGIVFVRIAAGRDDGR
jgi:hypothetical protein